MHHHPKVVAQHAGLVPDGRCEKCQGVWRGGRGERESAERGGGGGGGDGEDRTSLGQQKLYSDGLAYGFVVRKACSF